MIEAFQAGTNGFVWPARGVVPDTEDPELERGHLRITDDGVVIETLVENVERAMEREPQDLRDGLVVLTPSGPAYLPHVRVTARPEHYGSARAWAVHYLAPTVIGGIDLDGRKKFQPTEFEARFHGLSTWAGATAVEESRETRDGRLKSWTVKLSTPPESEQRTKLRGGRTLSIAPHWAVSGTAERRILASPTSVTCSAGRSTPATDLIEPLLLVQDLISFACQAFVVADSGAAALKAAKANGDHQPLARPWMWNRTLMVTPPGVRVAEKPRPLFSLESIGGIEGVRRWIEVSEWCPRAFEAVVGPYRRGFGTPTVRLMESAAAIEVWVSASAPAKWTNRSGAHERFPHQLAKRVGRSFEEFVGDVDQWGCDVWNTYNGLKHQPDREFRSVEVAQLAESARLLLGAAILDRVARTKQPSREIFGGGHLWRLGDAIRRRYVSV